MIGRSRDLTEDRRQRLADLDVGEDLRVITYDELLDRFRDLILQIATTRGISFCAAATGWVRTRGQWDTRDCKMVSERREIILAGAYEEEIGQWRAAAGKKTTPRD